MEGRGLNAKRNDQADEDGEPMPYRQRAFPCGIIRSPLDDRHLRGQAAAAGERLVKVCRRWGDMPKVPREAARCIMIVTNRRAAICLTPVADLRQHAAQARRLAIAFSHDPTAQRLVHLAEELEAEIARLSHLE
jgi:hypothetical protein